MFTHKTIQTQQVSQTLRRDETLRYDDGVNSDAIGNDADQIWRVAARFPAAMVQPYIGMELYPNGCVYQ